MVAQEVNFSMKNKLIFSDVVPALDQIYPENYMPAIDRAIEDVQSQLQKIKDGAAAPSFDNTVVPLESLFDGIIYIQHILNNKSANDYSEALAEVEEAVSNVAAVIRAEKCKVVRNLDLMKLVWNFDPAK